MDKPRRYHPLLVTLHWLVAIFVVFNFYLGKFIFPDPNYPDVAIAAHMLSGMLVLLLVIVRFVVRRRSALPPDATSGHPWTDLLARLVHYGLYALLILLTLAGIAFSTLSGRIDRVFFGAGPGGPPPAGTFNILHVHSLAGNLLLVLIALHLAAAFYHQFIRKDNLLARMWYGAR